MLIPVNAIPGLATKLLAAHVSEPLRSWDMAARDAGEGIFVSPKYVKTVNYQNRVNRSLLADSMAPGYSRAGKVLLHIDHTNLNHSRNAASSDVYTAGLCQLPRETLHANGCAGWDDNRSNTEIIVNGFYAQWPRVKQLVLRCFGVFQITVRVAS